MNEVLCQKSWVSYACKSGIPNLLDEWIQEIHFSSFGIIMKITCIVFKNSNNAKEDAMKNEPLSYPHPPRGDHCQWFLIYSSRKNFHPCVHVYTSFLSPIMGLYYTNSFVFLLKNLYFNCTNNLWIQSHYEEFKQYW